MRSVYSLAPFLFLDTSFSLPFGYNTHKGSDDMTTGFYEWIRKEEKAHSTAMQYANDAKRFLAWLGDRELCRERVQEYKEHLSESLLPKSVNTRISSLNRYFAYLGREDLKVRLLKVQKNLFAQKERELTKREYERLLSAAEDKPRLYYLLQTICATGIRVSEVPFITVEAIKCGQAAVRLKGKTRIIFLDQRLCDMLRKYAKKEGIDAGCIFITKGKKPLDRSNIHHEMKALCQKAKVDPRKVFPHNLRHLFARTFYQIKKDIVRLADVLGHSNINTTRIYTMESGAQHRRILGRLNLLRL